MKAGLKQHSSLIAQLVKYTTPSTTLHCYRKMSSMSSHWWQCILWCLWWLLISTNNLSHEMKRLTEWGVHLPYHIHTETHVKDVQLSCTSSNAIVSQRELRSYQSHQASPCTPHCKVPTPAVMTLQRRDPHIINQRAVLAARGGEEQNRMHCTKCSPVICKGTHQQSSPAEYSLEGVQLKSAHSDGLIHTTQQLTQRCPTTDQ